MPASALPLSACGRYHCMMILEPRRDDVTVAWLNRYRGRLEEKFTSVHWPVLTDVLITRQQQNPVQYSIYATHWRSSMMALKLAGGSRDVKGRCNVEYRS